MWKPEQKVRVKVDKSGGKKQNYAGISTNLTVLEKSKGRWGGLQNEAVQAPPPLSQDYQQLLESKLNLNLACSAGPEFPWTQDYLK